MGETWKRGGHTPIAVSLDLSQFNLAVKRLKERAPKAIARALNRAALTTRTVMVRAISQDVGLKVSTVKDVVTIRNANASDLTARVVAKGSRIPLMEFSAKGPFPSRGRGRGVTAKLKGGKGRYPHAFIARMASGHEGVFERLEGARRLPVYELHGPSIARVFDKYRETGIAEGTASLKKNLAHELQFAIRESAQG